MHILYARDIAAGDFVNVVKALIGSESPNVQTLARLPTAYCSFIDLMYSGDFARINMPYYVLRVSRSGCSKHKLWQQASGDTQHSSCGEC